MKNPLSLFSCLSALLQSSHGMPIGIGMAVEAKHLTVVENRNLDC